ncbi:Lrp/AsnC family transcriptional regulator [Amnibacterium flavum]|uniref:Lrp/AsnC family transcriptional regulator n=2 Tax=Amnibacterium flavum TaxID=2173173 RepID=A0A2V1HU36_9MICO|nr:Lrp/AsnC family transcriptional regulator [Amnibacterium flavum]
MAALVGAVERPHEPITLDETDMALLRALAGDSRLSQRALAREVNMSAPAVAERLARLERLGVIKHYGIEVDWDRLGFDVVVYMPITLEAGGDLEPTIAAFRQIPELEELTVITGQYDLLARFRLSNHGHLRELLLDRLWQIPNVLRIETMLSLGNLIPTTYTARILGATPGLAEPAAE